MKKIWRRNNGANKGQSMGWRKATLAQKGMMAQVDFAIRERYEQENGNLFSLDLVQSLTCLW